MRLHRILTSSFVSFSLAALVSCSSSTTTPPTVDTFPGVGSTFTMKDSTSVFVSIDTGVYSVTAVTGNIMTVLNPPGVANDTTRVWYQFSSDGNLWMDPKPSGSRADWFRFPFATQGQFNTTDYNGSDTIQSTAIGEGPGTFTVNGQKYPTQKVKLTMTHSVSPGSPTVSHWAFAPAIGYIVLYDEEEFSIQGAAQPAHHKYLISFVKK